MSRRTKNDDVYYQKKRNSLIPITTFLLVCGVMAYGVANLWHFLSGDSKKIDPSQTAVNASDIAKQYEQAEVEDPVVQPEAKDDVGLAEDTVPTPPPTSPSENHIISKSERVKSTYFDDAAFVGDSITLGMQTYDVMANTTIMANTGLNPQSILTEAKIRTEDGYITALEALEQADPKKIYILLGVNSIGYDKETFKNLYAEFVEAVKNQHPDSIIYIQSMMPVTLAYETSDNNPYDVTNEKIDSYNQVVSDMAKELGVYYLDVASALKDEAGSLPNDASPTDGIHFGPAYYTKWFDYLKTHTA